MQDSRRRKIMAPFRALLLIAALSTIGFAQGRGHGRGHAKGPPPHAASRGHVRETYTVYDRRSDARIISTWYRAHPTYYQPYVELRRPGYVFAPGYETRIIRSRELPVAYRTYVRPVPFMVISTLPPVRPGWEYVMLDDRVLLVDRPTWNVVDVVVRLNF
jgi:hypothetical protein